MKTPLPEDYWSPLGIGIGLPLVRRIATPFLYPTELKVTNNGAYTTPGLACLTWEEIRFHYIYFSIFFVIYFVHVSLLINASQQARYKRGCWIVSFHLLLVFFSSLLRVWVLKLWACIVSLDFSLYYTLVLYSINLQVETWFWKAF